MIAARSLVIVVVVAEELGSVVRENVGNAAGECGDACAVVYGALGCEIAPDCVAGLGAVGSIEIAVGVYAAHVIHCRGHGCLDARIGVYYLTQGDVAAAVKAFGSSKSNNAALAQILTKNYAAAKNTLGAIANPDATTYYLTAILGARTNNASMVTTNLDKAIKLDNALANMALNDLEFANFNLGSIIK